jgi:hypothetical protein
VNHNRGWRTWLAAQAALGVVLWASSLKRPLPIETPDWVWELLLLAALVIVPLGLRLVFDWRAGWPLRVAVVLQPPAAWSLLYDRVGWAESELGWWWSLPWVLLSVLLAGEAVYRLLRHFPQSADDWAHVAALALIVVGGGWLLLARLGIRPLDFEPIIVLLTAVHFHYAGFALPVVAGCAARRQPSRLATCTVVGVVAGVPLVAAGITATQLGWGSALECVAALATAAAAWGVAWLHLQLGGDLQLLRPVRLAFLLSAGFLAVAMALAALYGARAYLPVEGLTIPVMQALHGTANALGFSLLALLGWNFVRSPAAE